MSNDKQFEDQVSTMVRAVIKGTTRIQIFSEAVEAIALELARQRKRFDATTVHVHGMEIYAEAGGEVFMVAGEKGKAVRVEKGMPRFTIVAAVVSEATPAIRKVLAQVMGIRRVK